MKTNCLNLNSINDVILNLNNKRKKQLDRTASHITVLGPIYPVCRPEDLRFYLKDTSAQLFSSEYYEIFKSAYFEEHLRATAF